MQQPTGKPGIASWFRVWGLGLMVSSEVGPIDKTKETSTPTKTTVGNPTKPTVKTQRSPVHDKLAHQSQHIVILPSAAPPATCIPKPYKIAGYDPFISSLLQQPGPKKFKLSKIQLIYKAKKLEVPPFTI